ncbi:Imm17 family immunity protein [uncultured Cloacibacillus sp.]|uniref:Imm17 family immunity protein n=1 Tax=uncultured Cloacibacillus sp. TaxID=889794 RepID=UPI0032086AB4
MAAGALFVMGAVRNWCWLCDPVGKPYAHLLGRTGRRIFFFAAGSLLIVCGVMIEFHS